MSCLKTTNLLKHCLYFHWLINLTQNLHNNARTFEIYLKPYVMFFTLYRIAFAPTWKPNRIGLLSSHTTTVISIEQTCWFHRSISKVESHISDRFSYYTGQVFLSAQKALRYNSCNVVKEEEDVNCFPEFRGTHREYSSKPLKHIIVERILVFFSRYRHIFIPPNFFICSDFLA